jgi:hypothetical protein
MKTERRHELQTNVLADRIAKSADTIRPYGKTILGVVLLLLLAVVVLSFWNSQKRQKTVDGWDQFFTALSSGDESALEETASEYGGTSVASWAKLVEADITLSEATAQLFTDKVDAQQKLKAAVDSYQSLRDAGNEVIEQRAAYGLAQAHESLGDLAKARDEYEAVVKRWPNSPYARVAKQRAAHLDKQNTKEFYDWFAKYTPSTPASRLPGTPGVAPNFDRGLENEFPTKPGDVSLPSALDSGASGASSDGAATAADGATGGDTPAGDSGSDLDLPTVTDGPAGTDASGGSDSEPASDDAAPSEEGASADAAPSADSK